MNFEGVEYKNLTKKAQEHKDDTTTCLLLLLTRFLGSSTLFCGLGTSGLSLRRLDGTRVLQGLQVGHLRNKLEPLPSSLITRMAMTSRGATTPRQTSASHPNTARWEALPPTPIKCSHVFCICEWHFCMLNQGNQGVIIYHQFSCAKNTAVKKRKRRCQSTPIVDTIIVGYCTRLLGIVFWYFSVRGVVC